MSDRPPRSVAVDVIVADVAYPITLPVGVVFTVINPLLSIAKCSTLNVVWSIVYVMVPNDPVSASVAETLPMLVPATA